VGVGGDHISYLLVSCVVTAGVWRDVVLLGDVVAGRGEGGLLPRPGVLHGGVGDGHAPTASHFSLEEPRQVRHSPRLWLDLILLFSPLGWN